jgi:putative oxidoreductase
MNIVGFKWIFELLRFGLGGLLIFASLGKISHPYEFAVIIENYRVLGDGLSRWIAVWLPYLELGVGLLLVIGIWLDAASVINAGLLFIFLVLVTQAYIRHLDIDCGCFSIEHSEPIGLIKILENVGYFCGSLLFVYFVYRKKSLVNTK